MRIAMVSEHASPLAVLGGVDAGGQNVHVAALAGALADAGHEVVVHTRRDDPDLPDRVELCPGVVVDHVTAGPAREVPKDDLLPSMGAFGDALARAWRAAPPDVVHAHFWMSGLAALAGVRGAGRAAGTIPVVQTFHALGTVKRRHQGAADTSPPQRLGAERMIGRECDRVVATCRDEVVELRRMGVPTQVAVVPCGVDPDRFTPDGAAAPRDGRARFVTVGRLVPRKGTDTVIAALAQVPDAELVVAGGPPRDRLADDPEARRLLAAAREAGVADRVRLIGRVPPAEVPSLMRGADAVVSAPHYEPFGIVPLEAMACGVPVVASAVGGHLDSVVDQVTGRLVSPRDPEALAEVLRELAGRPGLRDQWGTAGRRRVLERFTWRRVGQATEQVYAELLASRAVAAPAAVGVETRWGVRPGLARGAVS